MRHNSILSYFLHALRAVRYRFTTVAGRVVLRAEKVSFGDRLVLKGVPLVKRTPGSVISLGHDVTIVSYSMDTALGINHAFKMETLQPDAIIRIGDHVGISGGTLCAVTHIELGSRSILGANVTIVDSDFHPMFTGWRLRRSDNVQSAPVVLEENVFVGTGTYVLKGVRIGRNSVIAAGSVVMRDVPANAVAGGNPAKVLRMFTPEEVQSIEADS